MERCAVAVGLFAEKPFYIVGTTFYDCRHFGQFDNPSAVHLLHRAFPLKVREAIGKPMRGQFCEKGGFVHTLREAGQHNHIIELYAGALGTPHGGGEPLSGDVAVICIVLCPKIID